MYPSISSFVERYHEAHGFERETPDPEMAELTASVLADTQRVLPDHYVEVLKTITEGFEPIFFPLLRIVIDERPTYSGCWFDFLDGANLLSFSRIVEEDERIRFYPPPEYDQNWICIGVNGGRIVFLDGNALGIWNHLPWDDDEPETQARIVVDDITVELKKLEDAAKNELRLKEGLPVFRGLEFNGYEWEGGSPE